MDAKERARLEEIINSLRRLELFAHITNYEAWMSAIRSEREEREPGTEE